MGLYEVMRDMALPHLWNVPAVAAIFSSGAFGSK